ncbi:MAG: 30S ribosomal protein S13 [Candidatus Woesearchaeota archaeon]|nr:30S ribosomal protein S13 [Candidatus Woesearchaeota archaeon]
MSKEDFKHIVRIANADLKGDWLIEIALSKIKGISYSLAKIICQKAKISETTKTGDLTKAQIEKLSEIIKKPKKYKIPSWTLNQRKDFETGEDIHLVGTNLTLNKNTNIKRLQKIRSYRGFRHAWGLPVRGQRTRSNFRKNKGKVVGVKRKKPSKKSGRV